MRAGQLSNPEIVKLLQPFVVTTWHGKGEAKMPADIKDVFTKAGLAKRSNVFMFVLDAQGQLVHGFNSLRGGVRGRGAAFGLKQEITKVLGKLNLSEEPVGEVPPRPARLPDLEATKSGVPAGVRLFMRPNNTSGRKRVIVELVAMKPQEWKLLSFPEKAREIEPEALRNWLVQMYPAAIRTVDQKKPFTKIKGSLRLEPAGSDTQDRYALLRGEVRLAKGDEKESAFEGTLQAVVAYRTDTADLLSIRGVVEGDYLYRIRGTREIPLIAAIESRPESRSPGRE